MGSAILHSKLTPPELPKDHLPRPHLIAALDAIQPHTAVLIIAGPGYGKSTLLAEWVQQQKLVIWYSLDKSDRDPAVFFSYLLAGFNDIWPDFGIDLEKQFLSAALQAPEALASAIVGKIDTYLEAAANPVPIHLILEDFHLLTETPEIEAAVQLMIERLPEGVRLAIASRDLPHFSVSRLRAIKKIILLEEEEMRFSHHELNMLLPDRNKMAPEDIGLLERSEGWPLGIQLLVKSLSERQTSPGERPDAPIFSGPKTQIFDYLAQEVLNRQPVALKRFLIQTAALSTITTEACDEIFERDDSEEKLLEIKERNLFLEHKRRERDSFRYHPLFADFLKSLSSAVGDHQERLGWGRRAVEYYRKKNHWITAFDHAMAIDDEVLAAEVLLQGFTYLRANGYWDSIQTCFNQLSSDTFAGLPNLWVMQGFLWEDKGLHAQAKGAFRNALEIANPETHQDVQVRAWLGIGIVNERTGDIPAARWAFERASEHSEGAEARVRYMAENALGMIELSSGRYPLALEAFKVCQELSAVLGSSIQAQSMNNIGAAMQGLGDFTTARHWFEQSLEIRKQAQETPGIVSCLSNLCYCNVQLGDLDTAIRQANEALELGGVGFHPAQQAVLLSNKGDALALNAEYGKAEACYQESFEKREALEDQPGLVHIWGRFAALRRKQGKLDEALAYSRRAEDLLAEENIGYSARLLAQVELAAVYLARQEPEDAEVLLSEMIELHREITGDRFGLAICLFYLSSARNAAGLPHLDVLKEALSLAALHGYGHCFGQLFLERPEMLSIAIRENYEPSLIEKLLPSLGETAIEALIDLLERGNTQGQIHAVERLLALPGDGKWRQLAAAKSVLVPQAKDRLETAVHAILQSEPEPLQVTTFGKFSLKRGDHQIDGGDWINRRSETLFKILLGENGHQVDRLELIGLLWPEALPDKTTDRKYRVGFNNLFSRLRKVLEPYLPERYPSRYVREANNSYGLYLPFGSWVDFLVFQAAMDRGDHERRLAMNDGFVSAYEEALDLYKGKYLVEDSYAEWCIREQERLHLLAVSASFELVKLFHRQGNFFRAVREGHRLMELEPWNDLGCLLLVDALLQLGRRKDARAAYERCKASMQDELGIDDSPELEELAKRNRL